MKEISAEERRELLLLVFATPLTPLLSLLPGGLALFPLLAPATLYVGFARAVRSGDYGRAFRRGIAWAVLLSASVILAIMVMPYIMSVSREVLLAVPPSQREAALALGATRWEAVRSAVVPYARTGIMGAVILGLGRALGETMAVTMLIGNRHEIAASLFAPGYTMAAVIANEFAEAATDMHFSALTYVALVLFGVTVLVNACARLLIWRVARGSGAGSSAL